MVDISVHELNKYYGANHVIKGITFEIYSGEKVGLLGKNGSGKTTIFKILSGAEPYESGSVSKATGKKIEMLAQIPVFDEKYTVEDILYLSFKEILDIYKEMKQIEGDATPNILARYGNLMEEYERLGGYDIEVKIEKICNGMNIDEKMRKGLFSSLSGGEKTRVNLARILLRDCDILLLDEPTNHLDLLSLDWVEKFLNDFSGTIVVVSHDRSFLDNVIKRIIEIDDGQLNFYEGNYSYYVDEKERRFLSQTELYEQQQKKIRQLETAAKRLHYWGMLNPSNKGLHKRAFAIEKRIEKMDKVDKPVKSKKITEEFGDSGFSGKEIVSFNSVYKSYGSNILLNDISLKIYRNDRIALIGVNGCGKTTFVKMIMGGEICDSGDIKVGNSARIAYLPQIIEFENKDFTVLETLCYAIESGEEKARNILAGFHFRAQDVLKKVSSLSGGEKSRLKLCLLMQDNVNFLILDEPTNHLDIESREWIEDAIYDFNGTILFISHDRYFLNKFADRVWSMENGEINEYIGGYEEYVEKSKKSNNKQNINDAKKQNPPIKEKKQSDNSLSFMELKRLEELEKLIAETEENIKNVDIEMESDSVQSDHEKLNILYEENRSLEDTLNSLYDEWLNLSQRK